MRLLVTYLLLATFGQIFAQDYPVRPNVYTSDSLRHGEWITFYDSLGNEVPSESLDIYHYCLMEIRNGKPLGQVECFYESGIRSWTGRLVTIDPEIKQGQAQGYHDNGALAFKAFYENDTIQGLYKSYHKNGILESEGQMHRGTKVGEWVFFYDNGNPIGTIGHVDGKEDGSTTIFYQNGKINSKGRFKGGLQDGYWETYFETGVLANTGTYVEGIRNGEWIYNHEDGTVKDIGVYKNDKEEGNHIRYHANGVMETNGHYKNGLGEGYFEYFYDNGQLSSKGMISKGLYQGEWVFYYANGEISSKGNYIDDKEDGVWKYYFENGADNREVTYKMGKENGPVTYYYDNGVLNAEGIFVDGEKHGEWKYYFANKQLQGIENYHNGILNGHKELRSELGNLINRGSFKEGKKHGTWEFYYENGGLSSKEEYEEGVSQGILVSFYQNGSKKSEGHYLNDKREGSWSYYHPNGQLSAEGGYTEGNSSGTWKYYYDNGKLKKEGQEFADESLGEWVWYNEAGRISSRGSFTDGLLHGPHYYYDSLGNMNSEVLYLNGVGQTFNNLYDSVDNLSLNGRYDLAEQTLEAAEEAYYKEFEKNELKKSDLYELIATFYRRKGDAKKAIKYAKKSMSHTLKHKDDTSSWYTATLDDLADTYTYMGDYQKAYETYQDVIAKIAERARGKESNEYARSFRYFTISLMNLGRYDEAIDLLHQDLKFRSPLPNQNINIAAIHYSIMDAHYPNLSPALDSAISNSIRFHQTNGMEKNWTYASTYYFKALVERDRNNLDAAYENFGSYINIATANGDSIDIDYVNSLIHRGNYHYNKLEYDLSRPYYERALVIGENPKIRNTWVYISTIKSIANQFWADDDFLNTLKYNQQLLELAEAKSDTSRIGQAYTGIALSYDNLGGEYVKDARRNHLKAIEVLSMFDEYHTHYVNANLHYATHLNNQQQELEEFSILSNMKDYLLTSQKIDSFYLYRTYNHLVSNYYDRYQYDSAILLAKKIIKDLEQQPGKSLQQYLETYRLLGDVLGSRNQDEEASAYYLKALSETEAYLGKQNESYLYALMDLAENFSNQSNPTSAILYYQRAIELAEQLRGPDASLASRIDLAEELISKENYEEALQQLNHVQQSYKQLDQTLSYNYLWCLRIKSRAYERQDDIKSAEELLLEGLAIAEKKYSSDSRDYASYIRRLGEFYLRNNEPQLAYQYVAPAIEIIEKTFGNEVIIYAWYAETMSKVLLRLDDYAQAVNLQEKATDIYLSQIGEEQDYMDAQFVLGELYAELGQYENSIKALEKSRESTVKKYSRYSYGYTKNTMEIAGTYLSWKKPAEALKELIVVKNLYDSMGVLKSNYPSWHNLMGWTQHDLKNLEDAKTHYQAAIHLGDSLWGPESGASMVYRNNLAFYHLEKEEFEEAERLWLAVEEHFNISDISSIEWLDNMAILYTSWGKLDQAGTYWDSINERLLARIKGDFPLLSESGKAAFWDSNKGNFEVFNTYAIKAATQGNQKALGQMYDNQLQTKSLLLNSTTKERKRILNSGNKSLLDTYNRYVNLKEDLVKYYGYTSEKLVQENIDLAALEKQAEGFEKALSINSGEEQKNRTQRNLNWRSVQRALLPDEVAVEIIRFRHFHKSFTDSILYAALILTPETQSGPILQVLPDGNFLEDKAIKAYRSYMNFKLEDKSSYEAFWQPIDQHLQGFKKVYLSLDGVYHQMNVGTLQKEDGSFVGDHQEFNLVSSTRTISEIKRRTRKNENATAFIFGNPTFDLSHAQIENDVNERGLTRTSSITRATTLDNFSFSELPGTKVETSTVNDVLLENQWATNLFLEENALEEELKRVDNPGVLHIATHGFFLDQPDESSSNVQLGIQAAASRSNALLRSGLLMTGATQTAKGEQSNSIENGIFTAYEAMNLDLSSTELVVLSACETGLGEIKNGEGVFGLQRAFQIAGAKSILMSLWKVDDAATQLLMTAFYDQWLAGASETEALRKAQETVRNSYPHPNYWGAFVLIGG